MKKINKVSYKFSFLFKLFLVLYPILGILSWYGVMDFFAIVKLPLNVDINALRPSLKIYACLVDMIPTFFVVASFYYLSKLFKLYSKNIIFSPQNVLYIRKIGYMFILRFIASFIVQPVLSIILTCDAPIGNRLAVISFDNHDLSTIVIGGIIILVSWIMDEGRKLEEDRTLTI